MRSGLLLGALCVAALLGFAWLWLDEGAAVMEPSTLQQPLREISGSPAPDLLAVADERGAPSATRLMPTKLQAQREPPRVDERGLSRWQVLGRLVDHDGNALADALIVFVPSASGRRALGMAGPGTSSAGDGSTPLPWSRFTAVRSRADGSFEIVSRDLAPVSRDEWVSWSDGKPLYAGRPMLMVEHPTCRTELIAVIEERSSLVTLGELRLERGQSWTGRVVDGDGQGVPGVLVRPLVFAQQHGLGTFEAGRVALRERLETRTDDEGKFTLTAMGVGTTEVEFSADGWVHSNLLVKSAQPGDRELGDILLVPGGVLTGTVVDGTGQPRAGLSVVARPREEGVEYAQDHDTVLVEWREQDDGDHRVETDDNGVFLFDSLAPVELDLLAGGPGLEPAVLRGTTTDGDAPTLVVRGEARLLLSVVDAVTGEPVPKARARARRLIVAPGEQPGGPILLEPRLKVLTGHAAAGLAGREGSGEGFVLVRMAGWAGTELTVSAPGYADHHMTAPGVSASEQSQLSVALWPVATLAGQVVDERGRPLEGATVKAVRELVEVHKRRQLKARSDSAGRFLIDDLTSGTWRLTASLIGQTPFDPLTIELAHAEDLDLGTLVMPEGGVLAGVVLDSMGEPIAGVGVLARREIPPGPEDPRMNALTDERGRFNLVDVFPGSYRLSTVEQIQGKATVSRGERTEVTLQARHLPRVFGRVMREGVAVEGAEVRPRVSFDDATTVQTDVHGEFELTLPVGPSVLVAWDGDSSSGPIAVDLVFEQEFLLDMEIIPGRPRVVISGDVTYASKPGDAFNGSVVAVDGEGKETRVFLGREQEAHFAFEDLPLGLYRVELRTFVNSADGRGTQVVLASASVMVDGRREHSVDFKDVQL